MLSEALAWWLAMTLAGWLSWPLLAGVLRSLPDRGYALAKAFGLLLWAYLFWLASYLGLPLNNRLLWWCVAALGALLGLWAWARRHRDLVATIRAEARHLLAAELVFALVFALALAYRAYDPAIPLGPQSMSMALLSGMLRNPAMPPADPWAAGLPAIYPYWGAWVAAMLARLGGIPAATSYNLALTSTLGLTALSCYGLIYNLLRADGEWLSSAARRVAALGAAAIALVGNWEGLFEYMRVRGLGSARFFAWLGIPGLAQMLPTGGHIPEESGWWLRAGRVITDRTLAGHTVVVQTEFPLYSLLLGDLGPTYLALPFLGLALAVGLEIILSAGDSLTGWWRKPRFWAMAWILGSLGPLEPWLLPTALAIIVGAWLLGDDRATASSLRTRPAQAQSRTTRASRARWLVNGIGAGLALSCAAVLLYLPYYLVSLGRLPSWEVALDANTALHHYLIVLGPWMIPLAGDALMAYGDMRQGSRPVRRMGLVWLFLGLWTLITLGAWLVGGWPQAALKLVLAFSQGPWLLLLQIAALAVLLASLHRDYAVSIASRDRGRSLSRLLLVAGLALTVAAEFVYARNGEDARAGTVVRLYQQAWLLLGVGAVCALARMWRGDGRWRLLALLALLLVAIGFYYPAAAAYTKTNAWQGPPTLDGAAHLRNEAPATYAIYRWLMDNAGPTDVLVEGPGQNRLAPGGRLATLTGLPTILGWPEGAARWRGPEVAAERLADLDTIYRLRDEAQVLETMAKYGATYLYIGPNEIERYRITPAKLAWQGLFMQPVLSVEQHRLYRVR